MRRTGERRRRAAAIPCCGEKRTLSRTGAGQKALLFEVPRQRLMSRTGAGQSRAGSRSATSEKTPRARGRNIFPSCAGCGAPKRPAHGSGILLRAHGDGAKEKRPAHGEQDRVEAAFRSVSARGRRQKALSFCHHFFLHRTLTIRYIAPDIISTRPLIK